MAADYNVVVDSVRSVIVEVAGGGPMGPAGPVGPAGVQGPAGPNGPQGPQGLQGIDGRTAYEVAVFNGFIGSEATWLASLVGPQGAQGADSTVPGPAGPQGETGPSGISAYQEAVNGGFVGTEAQWLASLVGPQGPQGIQGIQGETGPQGIQGVQGTTGISAYQEAVANGFVGTEAQWLASLVGPQGPQGIQGIQGIQGETGPQGIQGIQGVTGDSAYQEAVANGFVGTEVQWLASLVGPQGPQGPQGIQGIQGIQGDTGPQGIQGPQGDSFVDPTFIIQFGASSGENKVYTLVEYAPYAFTVVGAYRKTASGTITVTLQKSGASITGLSSLAVSSTQQYAAATAGNTFAVGNKLTASFTSNSAADLVSVMLVCTRA